MAFAELERWMWADACDLLARAERLHRQFFTPLSVEGAAGWSPPIDLYETDTELVVLVALPGVDPADIEIALADSQELWRLKMHPRVLRSTRSPRATRQLTWSQLYLLRFSKRS